MKLVGSKLLNCCNSLTTKFIASIYLLLPPSSSSVNLLLIEFSCFSSNLLRIIMLQHFNIISLTRSFPTHGLNIHLCLSLHWAAKLLFLFSTCFSIFTNLPAVDATENLSKLLPLYLILMSCCWFLMSQVLSLDIFISHPPEIRADDIHNSLNNSVIYSHASLFKCFER